MTLTFHAEDFKHDSSKKMSHHLLPLAMEEDMKMGDTKKTNGVLDHEKENTCCICLLEQKRKVVSFNIDVPPARKSSEELDMDKVTAAMVLTSLSTSPLVRSPPVRPNEGLSGSRKGACHPGRAAVATGARASPAASPTRPRGLRLRRQGRGLLLHQDQAPHGLSGGRTERPGSHVTLPAPGIASNLPHPRFKQN
ncbi:Zinc finger protein 704 [Heterocephalus glaber]|uniref:Zinc finger protein 704 n=1 Tax=Heterocephalus glaber TaxID=10181 RepID=G5B3C0_HETGA|nr:Zinc finger protein 704 [Heterocephalus glaber]